MLTIWTADNDRSRIAGTRVPSALDASGPHRAGISAPFTLPTVWRCRSGALPL